MLDENAFVVARHHYNLLDNTVEDGFDAGARRHGDVDAIVEVKFDLRVDRMVVLSEPVHYRPLDRPWKFPLVGLELVCQLDVDFFAAGGLAALAAAHCVADDPFDFSVEGIHFPAFPVQLALIFLPVPFKLVDQIP